VLIVERLGEARLIVLSVRAFAPKEEPAMNRRTVLPFRRLFRAFQQLT
jgi:hypothetical protein